MANIGPNSPMSPKIVDGSFAALFDNNEVIATVTHGGERQFNVDTCLPLLQVWEDFYDLSL